MELERRALVMNMIGLAAREKAARGSKGPTLVELTKEYGRDFKIVSSEVEWVLAMKVRDVFEP